tara:strand:+ start:466 stop:810 length:345 start_codon:yes stop_codon:yes gene_type:complete
MIAITEGKVVPIYPDNKTYYRTRTVTNEGLTIKIINHFLKNSGYRLYHISNRQGGISSTPYQLIPVNKNYKCLRKKKYFDTLIIKQYGNNCYYTIDWWNKEINKKLKYARRLNQ